MTDIEAAPIESVEITPAAEVAAPAPAPGVADDYSAEEFYENDKPGGQPASDGVEEPALTDEPPAEQIDAPLSWAKDAKDVFAALPREAQEVIATRERDREAAIQAKFREAAGTRQQVETEARQALQTVMQNHMQALQQDAQQFEPTQPDLALLNSADPAHRDLYFQQEAQYRHAIAQRDQLTQQQQEAQAHAEAIALQQQQVELQAEHAVLEENLGPEWSDPSARAKLLGDLTPIAAELGYSQELIAQARAADILAMRKVADWKAKAAKFDQMNKAKMVPVRAAKAIPPSARAGSPQAHTGQPVDIVAAMYPNDVRRN